MGNRLWRVGAGVRASRTQRASGWENKSSQGPASCQKGRKGATPNERVFKKRVMNGAQCYDNVREDKGGNVSRIHDWELLRSSVARATEKCLGKG